MLVYCRLPRGATACDRREEFAPTDFHDGPVGVVLRDDGTLYLLSNDIFTTVALVSTDGGDSFGGAEGDRHGRARVGGRRPWPQHPDDRLLRVGLA